MYKTIIEFKDSTPVSALLELRNICADSYNNRAGIVKLKQQSDRCFVVESGEQDYNAMQLGFLALEDNALFMQYIKVWQYYDIDPDENCNLLELAKKYNGSE